MQDTMKLITACMLLLAIGTSALVIAPAKKTSTTELPKPTSTPRTTPRGTTTTAPLVIPSVPDLSAILIVDSVLFPTAARIQIYAALSGTYTVNQEPCVDTYANQVISRLSDGGDEIASCVHTTGRAIKKYFLFHGAANISIEMSKCVNGPELTIDCYVRTLCVFITPKGGSVDTCVQQEPCITDEVTSMGEFMDTAAEELAQCFASH